MIFTIDCPSVGATQSTRSTRRSAPIEVPAFVNGMISLVATYVLIYVRLSNHREKAKTRKDRSQLYGRIRRLLHWLVVVDARAHVVPEINRPQLLPLRRGLHQTAKIMIGQDRGREQLPQQHCSRRLIESHSKYFPILPFFAPSRNYASPRNFYETDSHNA